MIFIRKKKQQKIIKIFLKLINLNVVSVKRENAVIMNYKLEVQMNLQHYL